jgi:hypothetical protein
MGEYNEVEIEKVIRESVRSYDCGRDFTTLDAWRKAQMIRLFFYNKVIPLLLTEKKFKLNIQIKKAGVSVTANVSEGYGRYHYQEAIQFYRMSRVH